MDSIEELGVGQRHSVIAVERDEGADDGAESDQRDHSGDVPADVLV